MKTTVMQCLESLLPLRQEAQTALDAEQLKRLDGQGSEEMVQTLGGLVRQLDKAINELRSAARTYDQRDRVALEASPSLSWTERP